MTEREAAALERGLERIREAFILAGVLGALATAPRWIPHTWAAFKAWAGI